MQITMTPTIGFATPAGGDIDLRWDQIRFKTGSLSGVVIQIPQDPSNIARELDQLGAMLQAVASAIRVRAASPVMNHVIPQAPSKDAP